MQVFNRHLSARGLTVFGLETMLIAGSLVVAGSVHGARGSASVGIGHIVLITALFTLCFYYNELYDLTRVHTKSELFVRFLQATGATAIILAVLTALFPALTIGGSIFLTSLGLLLVALPSVRLGLVRLARDPHLEQRVLILGTGLRARALAQEIWSQHEFAYRIVGFVDELQTALPSDDPLVIGSRLDLQALVQQHRIDRIVVSLSDRRGSLPVEELLQAKLSGVRVEDAATMYERITGKILIDEIKPSWLIFSDGFRVSRVTRALKRAFDIAVAAVGLMLAAPLMALTALAVRLDSRGPILYCQERVGKDGRPFTLSKFRSMRDDAEQGTPVWARDHDERVTRVGRVIRLTRLDELPQLWNVLRGDMSLVGPRPERPFFVHQLAARIPFYSSRHVVRPGVTGWAQVKYRYGSSVEDAAEKLRYDLYYIKHQSLLFDMTILLDTVRVVLFRMGAK
jgi:sugar transferase (PEP-CTERM system associated)